jgi:general L-amino acid transport system substrate-binding protein
MTDHLPVVAIAELLAKQSIDLDISKIPKLMIDRAEELLIDVVGLCVASRNTDYVNAVIAGVDTGGPCTAIGHHQTFSAEASALINGTATHGEDFDDTFEGGPVHSSTVIAPAVAKGDTQWSNIVKWTVYALVKAEELGINSQNLAEFTNSKDPDIKRFLGTEGNLGEGIGLTNDFAARIVKHVGNYGEIYDRNLGTKTKINLPRGQNQLGIKGGLLYSPPFR